MPPEHRVKAGGKRPAWQQNGCSHTRSPEKTADLGSNVCDYLDTISPRRMYSNSVCNSVKQTDTPGTLSSIADSSQLPSEAVRLKNAAIPWALKG